MMSMRRMAVRAWRRVQPRVRCDKYVSKFREVVSAALSLSKTAGSCAIRRDEYVGDLRDIVSAAISLSETVGSCAIRRDEYDDKIWRVRCR